MDQASPHLEQAEAALVERIAAAPHWDESCERAATELAEALVASEMPRREMGRRLRSLGLSKRAARGLLRDARRAARQHEMAVEEEQFADAVPVCPHCIEPLGPNDHFCPHCSGPVTPHAAMDPLGRVHSTGRAYRQAISGKPRLAVLVAMWMIFGPSGIMILYGVYLSLLAMGVISSHHRHVESTGLLSDLLKLLLIVSLLALYVAILWKITARWVRSRRSTERRKSS